MSIVTFCINGQISVTWYASIWSHNRGVYLLILLQTVDSTGELIGVVVCKLEPHRDGPMRGYIAMLAVKKEHRGRGIASKLVRMAVDGMIAKDADEVCLLLSIFDSKRTIY